ncbi:hypothetical protein ACIQ9J_24220 [Streptomyces sp. NPDC094153]|uniref:hypothetical protein n=1 Tax=Streptomyces sp. NPDC094153 TaxID=3366058 RepID=UPI00381807AA
MVAAGQLRTRDVQFAAASVPHRPQGRVQHVGRTAAELRYESDADANEVAQHLLDSYENGLLEDAPPWAEDVLRAGAENAVREEDICRASALLELAHDLCADAQKQVAIKLRLSTILWRVDPGLSERYLCEATEAVRAHPVPAAQILPLLHLLTAQGRIADAAEMRKRLSTAGLGSGHARTAWGASPEPTAGAPLVPRSDHSTQLDELGEAHSYVSFDANTMDLERFLQATTLTPATIPPIVQALIALTCSEKAARSVHWCRVFLDQSLRLQAPGWQALFSAMKAQGLLRLGDLEGAEEHALDAQERLPDPRRSHFAYAPVATLLRARTEMGKHVEAAAIVDQPVPDSLHLSVHGLAYFRARARDLFRAVQADGRALAASVRRTVRGRRARLRWLCGRACRAGRVPAGRFRRDGAVRNARPGRTPVPCRARVCVRVPMCVPMSVGVRMPVHVRMPV